MKVFGNIIPITRLAHSVAKYGNAAKHIDQLHAEGKFEEERTEIASFTNKWADEVLEMFDTKLEVSGYENVPEGPCVIIGNHQGYFDIIALFSACKGKQIGFVAKAEFEKTPLISTWIKASRGTFIKRGDPKEAIKSINEGVELLKQGFSLVIFPEGSRSKGAPMADFKAGSFKLATKAKVPIVPVVINGANKVYEDREIITKGQTVSLKFLPAIDTASLSRGEQNGLHELVENMIRKELGQEKPVKADAGEGEAEAAKDEVTSE